MDTRLKIHQINSNIEALKKSVADGKALIASAITNKGVSTSADATFQQMANSINNAGGKIIYLGTGTSYNVAHIAGYQRFTANNFMVCFTGVNNFDQENMNKNYSSKQINNAGFGIAGLTFNQSYNASNGAFTVSKSVKFRYWHTYTDSTGTRHNTDQNRDIVNIAVYLYTGTM